MNREVADTGLSPAALASLLAAQFVVALGYGVVLPALPFVIAPLADTADAAVVARHTGLLTAAYVAAPLLFAPLWGWLSDRVGRRVIVTAGLLGAGLTLVATTVEAGLALLYAGRFLNGAFAAAIAPAALALVADRAPDGGWRARRFAWLGMSAIIGFLVGPMIGGLVTGWVVPSDAGRTPASLAAPFLLAAILTFAAAGFVLWAAPGGGAKLICSRRRDSASAPRRAVTKRLLLLAAAVAGGVSTFEVGLALQGRELAMDPYRIGIMFAECSLVMLVAQGIVFSPLVKTTATRWLISPAFLLMAVGLALTGVASGFGGLLVVVGVVAGSAGVLSPILIYWVSLGSDDARGVQLGRESAAASLGQTIGSIGAGMLFGVGAMGNAAFIAAAALLLLAALASAGLPSRLAPLAAGRGDAGAGIPLPERVR